MGVGAVGGLAFGRGLGFDFGGALEAASSTIEGTGCKRGRGFDLEGAAASEPEAMSSAAYAVAFAFFAAAFICPLPCAPLSSAIGGLRFLGFGGGGATSSMLSWSDVVGLRFFPFCAGNVEPASRMSGSESFARAIAFPLLFAIFAGGACSTNSTSLPESPVSGKPKRGFFAVIALGRFFGSDGGLASSCDRSGSDN